MMMRTILGAVLIKNYASLDTNDKMFHMFFLKIATHQSTPKFLNVLKKEWTMDGMNERSKT
jgi:hypothetical protein